MTTDSSNAMFGMTSSGIPVSHLDYSYIGKCTDPKELEKIIKVLRSGEEGTYPELTTFAEKQLESINPKSKILRRDIPIQSYRDLESNERDQLSDDFKGWFSEISQKDSQLKQESTSTKTDNLPPVRSSKTVGSTTKDPSKVSSDKIDKSKRSAAPRGYREWDRFDPDKELQTLEQKEEQELKVKQEKAKVNTLLEEMSVNVDTSGKTEAEKSLLADREKDKGNEAFKVGDYKESLIYYTRSLQYQPTAAAYNNRAYANLKLDKYQQAIDDCNVVIEMEPDNLKAHIRRALAYQSTGEHDNARRDLNRVLEIEPNNKRAKELLKELSTQKVSNTNTPEVNGDSMPKKKGKRMKIIEVENDEETTSQEEKKLSEITSQNGDSSTDATDGNRMSSTKVNNGKEKLINGDGVKIESISNESESAKSKSGNKNGLETLPSENEKSSKESQSNHEFDKSRKDSAECSLQVTQETQVRCDQESSAIVAKKVKEIIVELPGVVVKVKDEGTSLFKLGRYAEASEKFTRAIEILEKDQDQFQSALSSLLNNRAACLQRMGDAFGCIKDCTKSLSLVPEAIKPLLKRASSNELLERYEESYIDFNAVMSVDPSNQTALNGKTRVSKHLLNTYGKSWRERIGNVKVSQTATSTELLDAGNSTSSTVEKSFNILGSKTPSNPTTTSKPTTPSKPTTSEKPTSSDRPTTNSGKPTTNSDRRTTNVPSASGQQESLEKKFEQNKERGNSFVKQGKLEEAIQCYTECIRLDPSKVAVYTNRALCYLRQEKFDLAEQDTTKALELEGTNVKALYRRGLARKGLEKYEEAAKDLVNLIKIEPTNSSGKKELDIVLSLCRERRKKQKAAANENPKEIPKQTRTTENKVDKKATRRRRVQIEEVNGVEEVSSKSTKQPTAQKPSDSSQSKAKTGGKAENTQVNKPKAPTAKDQKKKKIKLHKATAFDFFQAWNSVKQKDLSSYAEILRQLNPTNLPKVLSNKLDADMFRCIMGAIIDHLLPNGEDELAFGILQHLSDAQRFDMIKMFLDTNDCKGIREAFSKLATSRTKTGYINEDIFNAVLNKYSV